MKAGRGLTNKWVQVLKFAPVLIMYLCATVLNLALALSGPLPSSSMQWFSYGVGLLIAIGLPLLLLVLSYHLAFTENRFCLADIVFVPLLAIQIIAGFVYMLLP